MAVGDGSSGFLSFHQAAPEKELLMKTIIESNENYSVIDLTLEYENWTGKERYAVISDLSQEYIEELYSSELVLYMPYVFMSSAFLEISNDYKRNEKKFEIRDYLYHSLFEYEDGTTEERNHSLLSSDFVDGWIETQTIKIALSTLKEIERKRVVLRFKDQMTYKEIGEETGCSPRGAKYSVDCAIKKLRSFFEKHFKNDLSH